MELSIASLTDNRYQITLDPAWDLEQAKFKAEAKRWYQWIPCKNGGFISLYSEEEMLFKLTTKKPTARKVLQEVMEAQQCVEFHDELEILFPLSVIHKVAKLGGAKRRRGRKSLSPEEKKKLVVAGKAYRFFGKTTGKKKQKSSQIPSLFEGVS